jgi:formate/nitrite transporter FocA (FNT family)
MFYNLIPVTLGNILGGALVVMLHPARLRQLARALGGKEAPDT